MVNNIQKEKVPNLDLDQIQDQDGYNPVDTLLANQEESPVVDKFIKGIASDGSAKLTEDFVTTLEDQNLSPEDRAIMAAALMNQRRTTKP